MQLPGHLIAEYWTAVRRLLTTQHNLTEEEARTEIGDYLAQMQSHGAEDVIYHATPDDTASTLAKAFRQGGFRRLTAGNEMNSSNAV